MVLACHSEKLIRYFDPFIPNTVYSYSLKQKNDESLGIPDLNCIVGMFYSYPNVNKQLDSNSSMKSRGTFYHLSLMLLFIVMDQPK